MKSKHARRPAAFILVSYALHAVALVFVIIMPKYWVYALVAVLIDHMVIVLIGLWPRSTWLGANLVRLPAASRQRGEIALTFDDGPDPVVTPQVLAILERHGVHATFFCIGEKASAHPEICRDIAVRGHDVENHGQRHHNNLAFSGKSGWRQEIIAGQKTLEGITGRRPRFYRALAGLRNPFLDPVLNELGIRLASWTRRGYDTRCHDAKKVMTRLTRNLAAGDILLLHDGHAAHNGAGTHVVLDVLPQLLEEIRARKLHPVTLSSACAPN